MRPRLAALIIVPSLLLVFVFWHLRASPPASRPPAPPASRGHATPDGGHSLRDLRFRPHHGYAHNLMLRKGPDFRIYVRWLRGNMVRTNPAVNPTFDDPESFLLDIKTGVIRANIGDIGNFLNAGGVANSPLTGHLAACRWRPDQAQGHSAQDHSAAGRIAGHRGGNGRQPNSAASHKALCPETAIKGTSRWIAHHGRGPYPSQGHSWH